MTITDEALRDFLSRVEYPVSKEELINGLVAAELSGPELALVERLPRWNYESLGQVRDDLDEITRVHAEEVIQAESYADYLRLVVEYTGDVSHATKQAFNRTIDAVIDTAIRQGKLSADLAADTAKHLRGEFASLRVR